MKEQAAASSTEERTILVLQTRGGGYSGFQVTGMIEGFFWVWKFRFRDFFGYENLASIFLGLDFFGVLKRIGSALAA